MNVGYDHLSTSDVATILGVNRTNVTIWCRNGYIKYTNVGDGNKRPRYMFDEDEVERVRRLREKYGKNWILYSKSNEAKPAEPVSTATIITAINPDDYIPDDTEEIAGYIKKIRALKIQRDKLLAELDSIDETIKTMKAKVIESI